MSYFRKYFFILPHLLFIAGICFLFEFTFGFNRIFPHSLDWIQALGDTAGHHIAWAYYLKDPWQFPIGNTLSCGYPVSSNIGITDSLPLMAIVLKIFKPLFNQEFQFFGFWVFLNYCLQSYATFFIARRWNATPIQSFIFGWLVLLTPSFLFRTTMHIALSSHWLIILSVGLLSEAYSVKVQRKWLILIVLSSLIHPYLWAMVMICFAFKLMMHNEIKNLLKLKILLVPFILTVCVWLVVGMLGQSSLSSPGIGAFSAYLSSFFLAKSVASYEAYSYLGWGVFLVMIVAVILVSAKNIFPTSNQIKIPNTKWAVCFIFIVVFIASGFVLSWEGHEILSLFKPLQHLGAVYVLSIFRATGRFIWLAGYVIVFWSFALLLNRAKTPLQKRLLTVLLIFSLVLQVYDLKGFLVQLAEPKSTIVSMQNQYPELKHACNSGRKHFYLFPNQYNIGWLRFAFECGMTTSAANSARASKGREEKLSELLLEFKNGKLSPDSVYVIDSTLINKDEIQKIKFNQSVKVLQVQDQIIVF